MRELTAADELFLHQTPEPLPHVATPHEHWRESYYFGMHPRDGGEALILTLAHYPAQERMDSHQFSLLGGTRLFAHVTRPYDGDPHTTAVGPVSVVVEEPFQRLRLRVDPAAAEVGFDVTFTARTRHYALRRGTMRDGDEVLWDQSHFLQAGTYDGWLRHRGEERVIDGWWGQRDHSWGIRDHVRCPMWQWVAVQFDDGMYGIWHWEYANGAPVFTDGCYAAADGGAPVPVVAYRHDLRWTDAAGGRAADAASAAGLAGTFEITLEDGATVRIEGAGPRAASYGPFGGGQHLLRVRADDGREGTAIFELTGTRHHRYFPGAA